jgi:hypothetical protein
LFAFVLSTTIQLLHINGNCGGKVLLAHWIKIDVVHFLIGIVK